MRTLATLLVIFGLIIGIGYWTNGLMREASSDLTKKIDKISTEISDDNWTEAISNTEELEKVWDRRAGWWPVILDHQEMDNIEFSLAKTKKYVASKNKPLSLGQLSELKLMIKHIPRKEAVTLENIL